MTSMTLEISETRTITATGRLVAGETAQVTITGATPTALYLVAPDQTVIAACESFTPTGESGGGVGYLQLATEQVAALFANTPAGRMIAVWALVDDADGVAGAGWVPVVSAPMPDALIDLNIDFYLRASQVGAGLAIVDGKLVCTVNPDTYLTKTEAAQTYAPLSALAGKFNIETDSATSSFKAIDDNGRQGFYARGAVYLLPDGEGAAGGGTLARLADLPAIPVQSVNGQTGAVVLDANDISAGADGTVQDVLERNSSDIAGLLSNLRYALGDTITASAQLADRTINRVAPLSTNASPIVLTFPGTQTGARDFMALITNTVGNVGNFTFTPPSGAVVYGDGFTNSPASGETWLYSVTEVAGNVYWVKSVKMEVAQ